MEDEAIDALPLAHLVEAVALDRFATEEDRGASALGGDEAEALARAEARDNALYHRKILSVAARHDRAPSLRRDVQQRAIRWLTAPECRGRGRTR